MTHFNYVGEGEWIDEEGHYCPASIHVGINGCMYIHVDDYTVVLDVLTECGMPVGWDQEGGWYRVEATDAKEEPISFRCRQVEQPAELIYSVACKKKRASYRSIYDS